MSGVNQSEPINSLSLCSLSIWVFLEGRGGDCTLNIQTLAPLYITSTYFPSPCQFLAYILSIFWCTHSFSFMVVSAFEICIRKKAFHSSELLLSTYFFILFFCLLFSVFHIILRSVSSNSQPSIQLHHFPTNLKSLQYSVHLKLLSFLFWSVASDIHSGT